MLSALVPAERNGWELLNRSLCDEVTCFTGQLYLQTGSQQRPRADFDQAEAHDSIQHITSNRVIIIVHM